MSTDYAHTHKHTYNNIFTRTKLSPSSVNYTSTSTSTSTQHTHKTNERKSNDLTIKDTPTFVLCTETLTITQSNQKPKTKDQ